MLDTRTLFGGEGAQRHVHMVGVCGIGMAGVAFLLARRGFVVSGCDATLNRTAAWLESAGVKVVAGHGAGHITDDIVAVVHTAAVRADASELVAARRRGIPVFRRGEVLPGLLAQRISIAVSGTHGKTTTSTFITRVLHSAGVDPAWCIGGEIEALGGVAGYGAGPIVVEADESDGTVALYEPDIAVVTNIEFDHMEHFDSVEEFEACFVSFIGQARRDVVYCGDDFRARRLCAGRSGAVSYGLSDDSDYRARVVGQSAGSICFEVCHAGSCLGRIDLPVPGEHNARNALAAVVVGLRMGLAPAAIARGLARVALPRRRYECVADNGGVRVVSDYAHHPTEVAAVVSVARREPCERRLAVYQPHRYTRTRALGRDFPPSFDGLDKLVLTPVYAASEQPLPGGTVWDLYAEFRRERTGGSVGQVCVAEDLDQVRCYLRRELRRGDLLLVTGAGDVETVAYGVADELRDGVCPLDRGELVSGLRSAAPGSEVAGDAPLGARTTLGVGGNADAFVSVANETDIAHILAFARRLGVCVHVLGGGSNVLVSDLGVRGIAMRLGGGAFRAIRSEPGLVVAGAATPVARLLEYAEGQGVGGLEFLEGIPGTVGGAAKMNAGAWGKAFCEQVSWIRCLNPDGGTCILSQSQLEYGYRECSSLENRVVLEAALRVESRAVEAIRSERDEYARRRIWMKGLRSAGSVFRNPAGDHAGRLLDEAGAKGLRVGGARVTSRHANVVVAEEGATASDVRALMMLMRGLVVDRFECELTSEVLVWT